MNLELPLHEMTWGDLRAFVAIAANEDPADKVGQVYDENSSYEPVALWVRLDPATLRLSQDRHDEPAKENA